MIRGFAFTAFAAASLLAAQQAAAQTAYERPWARPNPIIVIDPYEANSVDWARVATDPNVKAVIHRAFHGRRQDRQFVARVAAAREKGLLVGAYLLGRPGDPIAQADALVDLANRTGVTFLALDIENLDPALSMTLPNAVRFIERVHEKTGRYPAFYTNWSTYNHISSTYGPNSVFAKTPLWVARFRNMLGNQNRTVWQDYSFWQFSSEINCMPGRTCAYRVPGTQTDMDVNIFNGTEEQLRALFRLDSRRTAIRGRTGSAGCARLLHPAWVGGGWRRREDGARRLAATGPAPSLGGRRRFSSGAPPLAIERAWRTFCAPQQL